MQNIYKSHIGEGTKVSPFCVEIGESIIGKNCKIQSFVYIPPGIIIGDHVFIGPHVCFTNVKRPFAESRKDFKNTIVGDNVIIGASATILPGLIIGDGSFIGAGSVVTKNVPPGVCVVGNPARILKKEITMEAVKEGLSEKKKISGNESGMGMKRDNPSQVPTGKTPEKCSKGGKSFKIT